jgi:hypothetical protein
MIVPKTHFEQVPLEVLKKLIEQQIATEEIVEAPAKVKKTSSTVVPVAHGTRNGKGRKS